MERGGSAGLASGAGGGAGAAWGAARRPLAPAAAPRPAAVPSALPFLSTFLAERTASLPPLRRGREGVIMSARLGGCVFPPISPYLFIMSHIPQTSLGWGSEWGVRAGEPLRVAGSEPVSRVFPSLPGGAAPSGESRRAPGRRLVTVAEAGRAAPLRAPPAPHVELEARVPGGPSAALRQSRAGSAGPPSAAARRALGERKGPRTPVTSRNSVIGGDPRWEPCAGSSSACGSRRGRGNRVLGAARRGSASLQWAVCGGRKLPCAGTDVRA